MPAELNQAKLDELIEKVVSDVAGAMGMFMAYLGDQAGVYRGDGRSGPVDRRRIGPPGLGSIPNTCANGSAPTLRLAM